jgi:hypothetical protein
VESTIKKELNIMKKEKRNITFKNLEIRSTEEEGKKQLNKIWKLTDIFI